MNLKHIVTEADAGKEVKYILKSRLEISERLVKKLKFSGNVLCNSSPVYVNVPVKTGDIVEVHIDFIEECEDILPENIDIDIIYEDDYLIVLNKQPSIVVHPTFNHRNGTIANALMYHLNSKGIYKKIRPVSRLDRDTSGIIIFAKNAYVQESLIRQMKSKSFIKEYIGVVDGVISERSGTIDLPIDRSPDSIMLRHISETGSIAITHFEVLENLNNATLLKFILETGRTHQIRVHCQAIGHPLMGETLYSDNETALISRQALHSVKVSFSHPFSGIAMELIAPIPKDIESLLDTLRK